MGARRRRPTELGLVGGPCPGLGALIYYLGRSSRCYGARTWALIEAEAEDEAIEILVCLIAMPALDKSIAVALCHHSTRQLTS